MISSAYPRLRFLLSGYAPGSEVHALDPDSVPESVVFRWPDEALEELRGDISRALDVMSAGDDEAALDLLGLHVGLPAGGTAAGWLRYLGEHLTEFFPHRKPQTINGDGCLPPRASRFTDRETGNDAATQVLRANESLLRAWSDDPSGPWRLHLYADLGRPVGHYLSGEEVQAYRRAGPGSAPEPARHAATGCVVVMRRDRETRRPYVATAYPEKHLPVGTRERYPDLPLLLGGYLGQDYGALDGNRWVAERNYNSSTPAAVRERAADQLVRLLASDDATLRADVEALGSYVMPDALRRWVTGLHRRMTRLDWSAPR
ncbi:RNase A-like domain-containing protein [Kineosporia sp. A_224]|uniref:contact-dependent growth inhibition system immunity protein n=1 Tax=Kineosporia sp. A_224 TaxID=1962180 RepID=UPI000B4BF545|nr:RNase A-like domain-containing protein [Kineosporia sp. A_224]